MTRMSRLRQGNHTTRAASVKGAVLIACAALRALLMAASKAVGGQAVMEGVMMRNKNRLAVAVRKSDGSILVESWPWFSLTDRAFLRKPFVRGFPVLLETLVNGIKALNFSASQAVDDEEGGELKPWHLALTLAASIGIALLLFVVVPHAISLGMKYLGLGGDADSLSFHVWDGVFKMLIFMGYILAISMVPDIRRVFQYHGAEHKVIWSYEKTDSLEADKAVGYSRLHPRCGTAFLLFVLSISIVLHAVLVPLLLMLWSPENGVLRHAFIVAVKLLLMVPISSMAYETIKFSSRLGDSWLSRLLCGPGLMMQLLTTGEPDLDQLEVAAAALRSALGEEASEEADPSGAETGDDLFPGRVPGQAAGSQSDPSL